jgi:hypothetical protein|tara:strand:+ start:432 stop:677 length:246 start_codon:yes stop_codon:yes gene_type:complete
MISYWEQIMEKHRWVDLPMHKVFKRAGLPTSTYYRAVRKQDIRLATAKQVGRTLDRLAKNWATGLSEPKKINSQCKIKNEQ